MTATAIFTMALQQSGMVDDNTVFPHYIFPVAKTQSISEIPANTLSDDIDEIIQLFDGFSDQRHRLTTSKKNSMLPNDTLMRQKPKKSVFLPLA